MKSKWLVRTEFPNGYGTELGFNTKRSALAFADSMTKNRVVASVFKIINGRSVPVARTGETNAQLH